MAGTGRRADHQQRSDHTLPVPLIKAAGFRINDCHDEPAMPGLRGRAHGSARQPARRWVAAFAGTTGERRTQRRPAQDACGFTPAASLQFAQTPCTSSVCARGRKPRSRACSLSSFETRSSQISSAFAQTSQIRNGT